jgi:hypothetical protein
MSHVLRVHVTEALIDRATERDSRHCMIAEAIQLARPHFRGVMVDLQTIRWSNPRTRKRYICLTPENAARALVAFDQGDAIDPFSVSLRPIQVTDSIRALPSEEGKPRRKRPSRHRELQPDGRTVHGGQPLPTGHLSNVKLSGPHFRVYGRRLLRP